MLGIGEQGEPTLFFFFLRQRRVCAVLCCAAAASASASSASSCARVRIEEQGMGWNKRSRQIDACVQGWGCLSSLFFVCLPVMQRRLIAGANRGAWGGASGRLTECAVAGLLLQGVRE